MSAGVCPDAIIPELNRLRATLRRSDPQGWERALAEVSPASSGMPSFSEFWEHDYVPFILASKARSSVSAEQGIYRNWLYAALGDLPLVHITAERLESLLHEMLSANKKRRTARYALSIISQVWKLARARQIPLPQNPCPKVALHEPEEKTVRLISPTEMRKIVDVLARKDSDLRDAVILAAFSGLTAGEIFRLTWADISLSDNTVLARDKGNRHSRIVCIPGVASEMLSQRHWAAVSRIGGLRLRDFAFPHAKGAKREWFSRTFARIALEEKWDKPDAPEQEQINFSSFRHTYTVWLISGGVPLNVVADLLGHKTSTLAQRYAHLAPSLDALCRSVLDNQWNTLGQGLAPLLFGPI
jgi:integrase